MSRYYVAALLLFLLVIEGTIVPNAVANFLQIDAIMVPRFLVVVIVFIGIYIGRSQSLIHGLIFGFVYDVVYTEFLGIYMFGFAFIGYIFAFSTKRIQDSVLVPIVLACLAVVFFEYYQYGILQMLGVTNMTGGHFANSRLLPTVLFNGAFAILALFPIRRLIYHVNQQTDLRQR
ncbi:rod shape-determining protein MreD [Alkalicoccobacillus murimartini]|uniref:Rod shape-determining protein MreD n=1 Tax=Alkalicoccobacillus murimartini TaxID=171685 RepID=A0ABT9YLE0_9BACI|nr:rod shape-determining protein MreD [Alkalicoccobacillus murimartini]MDQ0208002.1 rod shape-determining protein MreD [Alkalicoccobacillus murimartini]